MSDRFSKGEAGEALRTLVAFSAARSFSANTNNPLDVVLPLFQPIATSLHGQQFTAAQCAQELADRYDLLVSEELCVYWTAQLIKTGLLVPAADKIDSGAYVWHQINLPNAQEGEFAKELIAILDELRSFLVVSRDLIFQSYSDAQLVHVLKDGAISSMFPKLYGHQDEKRADEQYLFAKFVQYASDKPHIMESLATLRRAAVVCDLVLHTRTPHRPPKNSQSVSVYFDSPLVMDLIGLGGKVRKAYASRLLQGFKHLNFNPLINPDMVFEIKNNLSGLLNKVPRERYGPTATAMRNGEFKADYVEVVRDHLEAQIKDAGIEIDRNFSAHVTRSKMNDQKEALLLSATQSHYSHLGAAERDVRSIRGVYGRRGEALPRDFFTSNSIFLTSNELLATIASRFFREQFGYSRDTFPVVVTRSVAAALGDVVLGVATTGNMTLTELLVSAADATQYDGTIFTKIEQHLRQMNISEADDLLAILERPDFSQLAIDLVRGNTKNVTVESVERLTDIVRTRIEEAAALKVASERSKERAKARAHSDTQRAVISSQEEKLRLACDQLRSRFYTDMEIVNRLLARAHRLQRFASVGCRLLGIFVGLIVGGAAYAGTYYADALANNTELRIFIGLICALAAALPLMRFPSLTEGLLRHFLVWQRRRLTNRVKDMGYAIEECPEADSDLLTIMQQQFDQNLAGLMAPEKTEPGAQRATLV
jgi:hypothetical protein